MQNTNSMDKEKFGAFVSALRKEKGMTQKELAAALFVSDKAVSKWETAASLPDVALLIPLAEILGVTVTELLQGRKNENSGTIPAEDVENIVKTAVNISVEKERRKAHKRRFIPVYIICLVSGLWTAYRMQWHIYNDSTIILMPLVLVISSALFGIYFLFFAPETLPDYYDNNKINYYVHGPVRIHIPGVYFSNRNWKHILKALRIWCLVTLVSCPAVTLLTGYMMDIIFIAVRPPWPHPLYLLSVWETAVLIVIMIIYLGGLFMATYIPGKKYK